MSKLVQRLLIFFIGLPAVVGIVCLHQYHHLALHIVLLAACFCASLELHAIFSHQGSLQPKAFVALLSIMPPVVAFLSAFFSLPHTYIEYTVLACIMISMAFEVIVAQNFEFSNLRLMASAFIIFYSGYLPTYISRMTTLSHATECIALFLVLVFMCDSIAWLFGNLLGKNNRGIIKASPNKSIAGFIGGIFGSTATSLIACKFQPVIFSGSYLNAFILGLLIACFAIIGDLVESVCKRSANCKDSGAIIPGRGGILDSVDSVLFAAPVFYLVTTLLFKPL